MVGGGPVLSRRLGGVGGAHWDSRGLAPRWHLLKEGCVCVCPLATPGGAGAGDINTCLVLSAAALRYWASKHNLPLQDSKHHHHMGHQPIDLGDGTIAHGGHGGGCAGPQLPQMLGMMMRAQLQMSFNIENIMQNMGGKGSGSRKRGLVQFRRCLR